MCKCELSDNTKQKRKWREAVRRSEGDQKGVFAVFMSGENLPGGKEGVCLVRDHKLAKQKQGLKK